MATGMNLVEVAVRACAVELVNRGMLQVSESRLLLELSSGVMGSVSLPVRALQVGPGKDAALVGPVIAVRHEETSRIVSLLRGLSREDGSPNFSMGVVARRLEDLLPEREALRGEWVAWDVSSAGDVARRVADDVVLYGFPFMDRLRTADAVLEEMKRPPHRFIRNYDLAVLLMLRGHPADAVEILKSIGSPISRDPMRWASNDQDFAAFLDAFEKYFNVDVRVGEWPLREVRPEPCKKSVGITIHDRGVVRMALQGEGKNDRKYSEVL